MTHCSLHSSRYRAFLQSTAHPMYLYRASQVLQTKHTASIVLNDVEAVSVDNNILWKVVNKDWTMVEIGDWTMIENMDHVARTRTNGADERRYGYVHHAEKRLEN